MQAGRKFYLHQGGCIVTLLCTTVSVEPVRNLEVVLVSRHGLSESTSRACLDRERQQRLQYRHAKPVNAPCSARARFEGLDSKRPMKMTYGGFGSTSDRDLGVK
eukprot:6213343-Pleurochrysis_carterae.AAC.4